MFRTAALLAITAFSASVSAEGIDYTYIHGSWGQVNFDEALLDVEGDGFGVAGSVGITDNFHLFGEYQTANFDFDVDLNILEIGVGYNHALADNVDLIGRFSYLNLEASAPGVPSNDEDAYALGVGLRTMLTQSFELNGGIDYVDPKDSSSENRINAGVQYNFTENFSAGLRGTWWDDVNVYQVNARFYF